MMMMMMMIMRDVSAITKLIPGKTRNKSKDRNIISVLYTG
jgi:hypothetical protein